MELALASRPLREREGAFQGAGPGRAAGTCVPTSAEQKIRGQTALRKGEREGSVLLVPAMAMPTLPTLIKIVLGGRGLPAWGQGDGGCRRVGPLRLCRGGQQVCLAKPGGHGRQGRCPSWERS